MLLLLRAWGVAAGLSLLAISPAFAAEEGGAAADAAEVVEGEKSVAPVDASEVANVANVAEVAEPVAPGGAATTADAAEVTEAANVAELAEVAESVAPGGTAKAADAAEVTESVTPAEGAEAADVAEVDTADKAADATRRIGDEDQLLCVVTIDKLTLDGMVLAYANPSASYLPLGEFAEMLGFGLSVESASGTASGTLARPSQPFALDVAQRSVTVSGSTSTFGEQEVLLTGGDIYVEAGLLSRWFSMKIELNRFGSSVAVHPFETLPIVQRFARERRGGNTWGYGRKGEPPPEVADSPYHLLSGSSIDLSLASSFAGGGVGAASRQVNYYTRVTGDILWMSGQFDLSGELLGGAGSAFSLENGNVLLHRQDPLGRLLGPLKASKFGFGDIQPESLPVVGSSRGPGFMISSYPQVRNAFFDDVSLKGYLPSGWDVELLRNGQLLDYRPSNAEEQYAFNDIPLMYGMNELKLAFHGPYGEERQEEYYYNVGSNMMVAGQWAYQLTITDESRATLLRDEAAGVEPWLTWKSTLGVSRWLTLENYVATELQEGGTGTLAGVGLKGYFDKFLVDGQYSYGVASRKRAYQAGFQTSFKPVSLSLRWQEYEPGWVGMGGPATTRSLLQARVDGIRPWLLPRSASLSLEYKRSQTFTDSRSETIGLTSRLSSWGVHHTHAISYEKNVAGAGAATRAVSGASFFNLLYHKVSLRGDANYTLYPDPCFKGFSVAANRSLSERWGVASTVAYTVEQRSVNSSLSLNWRSDVLRVETNASYSNTGRWGFGLRLSTNLSREPVAKRWLASSTDTAGHAAASVSAYLDRNRNRVRDDGEKTLEGVGFFVNNKSVDEKTGKNGVAYLHHLSPGILTDIAISPTTLEELFWVAADKKVTVVPRPGCPVQLQIPVWGNGEVSGKVYRCSDAGQRAFYAGIVVEAFDSEGKRVGRAVSEYDGFYVLGGLPPGRITISLSQAQSRQLHVAAGERVVDIPDEGGYIDNIELDVSTAPNPDAEQEDVLPSP